MHLNNEYFANKSGTVYWAEMHINEAKGETIILWKYTVTWKQVIKLCHI